ncbi:Putative deoxyribose-phosphate aldolase [Camponotus floridanus]|uniref:deoxyribose-phosphate aldolase n=1 Tax=Camponotus floridanus TaxID=104421 RepID=E2AHX3_CAMFO|nr:deoxyribose-phosphate aldolase isoform X1 [Camponotus floridanus]EFN66963.1 Putative deoxyribose-phosphate aldolase [Camponotus floridanus]
MNNPPIIPEVMDSIKPWLKFLEVYINEPSINKSIRQIHYLASTLTEDNRVAWLLKVISFIDLTTLSAGDTSSNMESLCKKATKIVKELPFEWSKPLHPAGICVYPSRIKDVLANLKKLKMSNTIKIASVAAGFPSGQYPLETRLQEVRCAIEYGAQEIDVVIDRTLVLNHEWIELYNELVAIRNACDKKNKKICLKVILSTGELFGLKNVYKASMIAMFAGADFIKTSTGKEDINATLPVGIVMCRAIKEYERLTSRKVGFKPAGGIKTAQNALEWMVLVKEELGSDWLTNCYFRIGASSLLDDIINDINETYNNVKLQNLYKQENLKNENEEKIEKKPKSKKES